LSSDHTRTANILQPLRDTPIALLLIVTADLPCTVLAKLEFFNPGGSVKDRIGIAMIEAAEEEGILEPGGTIIEGTSGNTGMGLALAAIAKGYQCIFTITDKQSQEKINVLRAMGAEVIVCPTNVSPEDSRSYYSVAKRLSEEIPNSFYPNQYDHPANTEAHYRTTGPEIWDQTEGRVTHFVAGAGTGGTISGISRYLKEQNSDIQTIGVDPDGSVYYKYFHTGEFDEEEIHPYVTEGVGEDILAENMNFDLVDDYVRITDRESMQMTRKLAREEGLFVGGSSGMAVAGVRQWVTDHADEISEDDVIVVLIPDSGFRYLSKIYNDDWMRNHGFMERETQLTAARIIEMLDKDGQVEAVDAEVTLSDAIARLIDRGISQMPVIEGGEVIGSLTERSILNKLMEQPGARESPVREVMGKPFPVVPREIHVDHLSSYLEKDMGAVLVHTESGDNFEIITKSDLISALANVNRTKSNVSG
jgi:cystathionine beta-synthase